MQKIPVLYLVPDLFGPPSGIACYCRMVCRALTETGHDVTVVSLLDQAAGQADSERMFPSIRYRSCAGNRKLFVARALQMLRYRPRIVLVGHPNLAPLGRWIAKFCGARLVTFIYGIDAWEPLSTSRRGALCSSDAVIAISNFTARRAAEVNSVPLDRVRILHNCIDPQFMSRDAKGPAESRHSLLTVARMSLSEQYKGHDVVIRALPALLREFPDVIYNVVGGGDGRPVLEALAAECGVAGAVRFHGIVTEEELIRHYHEASLFVMPSRFEGFGFVFLEAMGYGKPVVCGNEDASVEVVRHEETGLTVAPQNTEQVAQAIARLLRSDESRRSMGRRGREIVANEFSFERFRDTLSGYLCAL